MVCTCVVRVKLFMCHECMLFGCFECRVHGMYACILMYIGVCYLCGCMGMYVFVCGVTISECIYISVYIYMGMHVLFA